MNIVRVYGSFDDLPAGYRALFASAESGNFFLTLDWFRLMEQTVLSAERQLRLYGVEASDGSACALLPMCHPRAAAASRQLASAGNFYTPLFQPLTDPGCDRGQLIRLLEKAICSDRPRWESVHFFPVEQEIAMHGVLSEGFLRYGLLPEKYLSSANWYLRVAQRSYASYFDTLPAQLRNTLLRKTRALNKNHTPSFRIFDNSEHIEQAIRDYQYVYAHSWKEPEAYPDFIPALIRLCARNGSLRLGIAYLDRQAVAAQLWIVHAGVASIYKLAYHDQFSSLSVGSLLTARLMQHAIDTDHVAEVDFLTGDDAYKRDWMSHRRERYGLMLFNLYTARGLLKAGRHLGKTAVKTILHRLQPRATGGSVSGDKQ